MQDCDWKDVVDFGYAIFFKIYCVNCGKIVCYSCTPQREMAEDGTGSKVKTWCEQCMMKEAGGIPPVERYMVSKDGN